MLVRRLKYALKRMARPPYALRKSSKRPVWTTLAFIAAAALLSCALLQGIPSLPRTSLEKILTGLLLPDFIDGSGRTLNAVQTLLFSSGEGSVSAFGSSPSGVLQPPENEFKSDQPLGQLLGESFIKENDTSSLNIPEGEYPITARNMSGQSGQDIRLLMIDQTSYAPDVNASLRESYPVRVNLEDGQPVVLIVNTHTTESYVEEGVYYYSPPYTAPRVLELNKNVSLAATALTDTLNSMGVPAIQCTEIHDYPSYNTSYSNSLKTIQKYMEEYPSIKYVIDVHRDSLISADGTKLKPTIMVNGQACAQVMIVTGTDEGGAAHPGWRENLTVAAAFQQEMNESYPQLARPIYLRTSRFNQHTTPGAMILEVGSCGSTFQEAVRGVRLAGECLARLILRYAQ